MNRLDGPMIAYHTSTETSNNLISQADGRIDDTYIIPVSASHLESSVPALSSVLKVAVTDNVVERVTT